jgi:hypothetical protein
MVFARAATPREEGPESSSDGPVEIPSIGSAIPMVSGNGGDVSSVGGSRLSRDGGEEMAQALQDGVRGTDCGRDSEDAQPRYSFSSAAARRGSASAVGENRSYQPRIGDFQFGATLDCGRRLASRLIDGREIILPTS